MAMHAGKIVKAKMVLADRNQIYMAEKLKKTQPYLSQRICGHSDFSRADMLVIAKELNITKGEEFLATFFPEVEWQWEKER